MTMRTPLSIGWFVKICSFVNPLSRAPCKVTASGVAQSTARQIERARYATLLLQQGVSTPDAILETGYFDQPHLTRSLKLFIGQTPAQILCGSRSEQLSFLYKTTPFR